MVSIHIIYGVECTVLLVCLDIMVLVQSGRAMVVNTVRGILVERLQLCIYVASSIRSPVLVKAHVDSGAVQVVVWFSIGERWDGKKASILRPIIYTQTQRARSRATKSI